MYVLLVICFFFNFRLTKNKPF